MAFSLVGVRVVGDTVQITQPGMLLRNTGHDTTRAKSSAHYRDPRETTKTQNVG